MRIVLIVIMILSLAGIADSGYALMQHYAPADSSSCDFNATVSCTAVNQSEYSVFYGIPVAGIGIAGYLAIGVVAAIALGVKRSAPLARWLMPALSLPALGIAIWLTYIEMYVLKAVCPLCVVSQLLIATIAVFSVIYWR